MNKKNEATEKKKSKKMIRRAKLQKNEKVGETKAEQNIPMSIVHFLRYKYSLQISLAQLLEHAGLLIKVYHLVVYPSNILKKMRTRKTF
jgi:hypothetical protein